MLVDLLEDGLPKLAAHIQDLGVDLPAVTFAWFLSLYTDCLPVEVSTASRPYTRAHKTYSRLSISSQTLFRVWDVLLVEGNVFLFRVAVAIFSLNEKDLLDAHSPSAFYSLMHSMTSHLFCADKVIKVRGDARVAQV